MKNLFYALMLVFGMSVLSSCSKADDSVSIIGTWEAVSANGQPMTGAGVYLHLKENGTCFYIEANGPYVDSGTWSLSGDTLILATNRWTEKIPVMELTKDSLTIAPDGILVFKRVPDSDVEKYLKNVSE